MKTISQPGLRRTPAEDSSITLRTGDQAARLFRRVREIAAETGDAIAGVFGMPLRHPLHDEHLDGLSNHLLRDIGRE